MANRNRAWAVAFLTPVVLLVLPASADAHALGAEAKLKDGRVQVEGFFDDDTPAADARVWVEDDTKTRLAEGRMDDKGRWSFPAPPPGRYRVTVDASGGHRATVTVTIPGVVPPTQPEIGTGQTDDTGGETLVVSEGKSREEFTRFPWARLGLGLALIGLVAFSLPRVLRVVHRKGASAVSEEGIR